MEKDFNSSDIKYTAVLQNTNESGPAVLCTLFGANEFGISENQIGGPNGHNGAKVSIQESSHSKVRAEALVDPFCIIGLRYCVESFEQLLQMGVIYSDDSAGTMVSSLFRPLIYRSAEQLQPFRIDCNCMFGVDKRVGLKVPVLPKQSVTMVLNIMPWSNRKWPAPPVHILDKNGIFQTGEKYYTAVLENTNKEGEPVICSIFNADVFGTTNSQKHPEAKVAVLESSHAQVRAETMSRPFKIKAVRYIVSDKNQLSQKGFINGNSKEPIEFDPTRYMTKTQQQKLQVDCPNFSFEVTPKTSFDVPVLPGCKVVVVMEIE